ASDQGVRLGVNDEASLLKAVRAGEVREDLESYLDAFALTLSVLQTERALERVAYELACDCAAENVLRLEARFSPVLNAEPGLSGEAIVEAVLAGLRRGAGQTGISTGLILCGIRSLSPVSSLAMAKLASRYRDAGVCGFDLAGPEAGFPARDHQAAFDL